MGGSAFTPGLNRPESYLALSSVLAPASPTSASQWRLPQEGVTFGLCSVFEPRQCVLSVTRALEEPYHGCGLQVPRQRDRPMGIHGLVQRLY